MSGHNKWTQIKRQKEKTDGQKSKTYSKYARLLYIESRKSGGNMTFPSLVATIERAKKDNVPKDVIERAIRKGSDPSAENLESITYEAYGPGGVAIVIEALTENKNKAAQEIKHILSELASIGSATWAFSKSGIDWIPTSTIELSEKDMEDLQGLVEALENNDEVQNIYTNAE